MHVFDVSVDAEEEGAVKLGGRVLEAAHLAALRQDASGAGAKLDVSNVRVLRKETPMMRTVATNLTDLHAEPSFLSELLTQVTNGDVLEVMEEKDRWCFVRQSDGYVGWAYKQYLVDSPPLDATHLTHYTVTLFSEPVGREL